MIYNFYNSVLPNDELQQILSNYKIESEKTIIPLILSLTDLPKKHGRESIYHRALKKAMVKYLKDLGEPEPLLECGYIDVYAPFLGIIIECGDTPIRRIIDDLFHRDDIKEVWSIDDSIISTKYELIKFRRSITR